MYLAIDEGTTNVKGVLFDSSLNAVKVRKLPMPTYFPREGWVEQNPEDMWNSVRRVVNELGTDVRAIGITNQRETAIVWNAETGKPIYNAIVWSCRRTADFIKKLSEDYGELIGEKTGLPMDAYFSASKIRWILDHVPNARDLAKQGKLKFGTVDSYLIWKFTGRHLTDHTNASRTMLYNIKRGEWDDDLLEIFEIPESMLPEIKNSSDEFGYAEIGGKKIPILGVVGDQQAALLAHGCHNRGETKITYGTGTFILVNTGQEIMKERGLVSTVAWALDSDRTFAVEGSILSSGLIIEWLKSMGLWSESVGDETSLYFVPAFLGLGSPYWDPYARGMLIGITPYTNREHITRATLESIGYMVRDILELVLKHVELSFIRVDGGMTRNDFLMQFQADILGISVQVPEFAELTALGAGILAAMGDGKYSLSDTKDIVNYDQEFMPEKSEKWRENRYEKWRRAVQRSMGWATDSWEN